MNVLSIIFFSNIFWGFIAACYDRMVSCRVQLVLFTGLCGFLSKFGLSSCLMRACFCYFYFLEGEWSDTFYILLSSLLTTSYQDILVIWHACCASTFLVIPGALAWRALGIPWFPFPGFLLLLHWRLVSVNFGHYLAHFLGVSTSFFSTVSYHIPWRSLECLFD